MRTPRFALRTKKQPTGIRWVDISKLEDIIPTYQSRPVAKEIKRPRLTQLYATTPLECLRMAMSSAMNAEAAWLGKNDELKLMTCDVSRAYIYTPAMRPVHARTLGEEFVEGDENRCGNFNALMNGTWGAALNWHEQCKSHLEGLAFGQGTSTLFTFTMLRQSLGHPSMEMITWGAVLMTSSSRRRTG